MKKYLVFSLLLVFALFSNLSAQKPSEQFNGTKFSIKSPLLIDHLIKNKQVIEQRMHPLNLKNPNKHLIQPSQFTPADFQNNKANTDELAYFYDSAFLYNIAGDIIKLSSLRDAGGNVLSELKQVWDTVNNNWGNYEIRINTYDASGNQLSVLHQDWDIEGSQWVNRVKYRFTLDEYGNRITTTLTIILDSSFPLLQKFGKPMAATGFTPENTHFPTIHSGNSFWCYHKIGASQAMTGLTTKEIPKLMMNQGIYLPIGIHAHRNRAVLGC